MAEFIISAFADEAAQSLDEQIEELNASEISFVELRGIDGVNCDDLSVNDAKRIKNKLDENGICLSALGSPYGKIGIKDPFEEHLEKLKRSMEICHIFECNKIRAFSFFYPQGEDPSVYREKVLERLEKMLQVAEASDILLCHENEKDIYGDTADRCIDLFDYFGGRLGIVFDPANYIQCGVDPKEAYERQKNHITYFHMKDAIKEDGSVVTVGNGDGSIVEILNDVNNSTDEKIILTVEPHLHIFSGLSELQREELQIKESYPDSKTAFRAACSTLKNILKEMEG